jgi:hypothetical protein
VAIENMEERISRIEARQAIGDLVMRYAMAVDTRDLDALVGLFVEDVELGRFGRGRDVLRAWITPVLQTFYRSVHLICGQTVEFIDRDTATGVVYCRAEHEVGDRWFVVAMRYQDQYCQREGHWFFVRRQEEHWYTADSLERPGIPDFNRWTTNPAIGPSRWPDRSASWPAFWSDVPPEQIARLTILPTHERAG